MLLSNEKYCMVKWKGNEKEIKQQKTLQKGGKNEKEKKLLSYFIGLSILMVSVIPNQNASARPPIDSVYQYVKPQDFVYWVNDKRKEELKEDFVKAYKNEQGYLLAPKIKGAILDNVCWGLDNVTVNYRFHNANISWRMNIYPIKDCKKEAYYSKDIGTLVYNRGAINYNQKEQYTYTDIITQNTYTVTSYHVKKKLRLGDNSTVDCVQYTVNKINETTKQHNQDFGFHFFASGMYVHVYITFGVNGEKYLTEAMKNCTFQKYYTNPSIKILKKKNKVSKKNAIVYASIYIPTKKQYTYVDFYLYDKKRKKYTVHARQRLTKKNSDSATIRFDVKKCIKSWKRRSTSGKKYTLDRKKKYKYKIQVKVGGKLYQTVSSFKMK